MMVVAYLPAQHRAYCATRDPSPSTCDCNAEPTPLVTLADAEEAIRQAVEKAAAAKESS